MELQNLYEEYDNLDKRENISKIYTAASKLAPIISQLTHRIKNGDTVMTGEEIDALNLPFSQGMLPSDNIKPSDIYMALDKELDVGLTTYGYEGEDISFLFDFYDEHQRMPFLYSDKKGATQKDHSMGRIQDLQDIVSSKTGVISTELNDAELAFEEFTETMEKDTSYVWGYDDKGYKEFINTIESKYNNPQHDFPYSFGVIGEGGTSIDPTDTNYIFGEYFVKNKAGVWELDEKGLKSSQEYQEEIKKLKSQTSPLMNVEKEFLESMDNAVNMLNDREYLLNSYNLPEKEREKYAEFFAKKEKEFVEKYNRAPGISRGGGYTGPLLGTYGEARYRGDENINYFDTNWQKTYSLNEEGLEDLNLLFDTFHHDTYIPNQQELDDLVNATEGYISNYKTGSSKSEAIWSGDVDEGQIHGGLDGYINKVNGVREALKELDYIKTLLESQNKLIQGA